MTTPPRSPFLAFARSAMLVCAFAACASRACAQPATQTADQPADAQVIQLNLQPAPELSPELRSFLERLDVQRQAAHVPALSIAIIYEGKIVLAAGLGTADLETSTEATAETRYSIGSTTKHITAALLAQLEAEGVLGLDDHPAKYLPRFQLADQDANESVNLRDLLSHRTGLTRMSLLWYGNDATFDQILGALPQAELYRPFRTEFLYNNVMYACAGQAAGVAASSTWDDLVNSRIFAPAGMDASTTALSRFIADPRHATGYRWDEADRAFEVMPPRDISIVAPAGSIYSTVMDMATWAQILLNDGIAPNGTRVLAPGVFETIATEHIAMNDESAYGLGLFLDTWQGQRIVQHGGNIDGYFSTFALMPDQDAAVIALGNVTGSPLQQSIVTAAWEMLFPDRAAAIAASSRPASVGADQLALKLDDLVGAYALEGTPLSITIGATQPAEPAQSPSPSPEPSGTPRTLTLTLPGQPPYTLTPPASEQEPWTHTRGVVFSVRFITSEAGVVALEFTQGPSNAMVPRVGREAEFAAMQTRLAQLGAPFTPEQLARFEGEYLFELQGANFTVSQLNGRLAVAIPGQINYELEWPDDDGWWVFRMVPAAKVRFKDDTDAQLPPVSMELAQGPGQFVLPRVKATGDTLPTPSALLARVRDAMRSDAWSPDTVLTLSGTIRYPNQGIQGTVETVLMGNGDLASHSLMKPFAIESVIIDHDSAWTTSNQTGDMDLDQRELEAAAAVNPVVWGSDWASKFESVEIKAPRAIRDVLCYPVALATFAGAEFVLYVDVDSSLIRAIDIKQDNPLVGPITVRTNLDDYRRVGQLMIPMRWSGEMLGNGAYEVLYTDAAVSTTRQTGPFIRRRR